MDSLSDFPHLYSSNFKLSEQPSDERLQDVCDMISERMRKLVQSDPKVSVVFPAFNEEMYLPLMLWTLSKLATSTPIEIIGVNNASSDRTREIIEQCGITRIDEEKKGVSYARQAGLENAKGQLIATTDADAQVPETWIDANLRYFYENPDLVCFSGESTMNHFHPSRDWILKLLRPGAKMARRLSGVKRNNIAPAHINAFSGSNMFFKRDDALAVGGYQAGFDLNEDSLLAHRLQSRGKTFSIGLDNSAHVYASSRRISKLSGILEMYFRVFRLGLWRDSEPKQYVPDKPMTFPDVR